MPFLCKDFQWNRVDVLGNDGLLQHGRVVDCNNDGLLVDFGCDRSPQLTLFGKIYRWPDTNTSEDGPDEALVRSKLPDRSFKWYPCVWKDTRNSYGVIHAMLLDGEVTEIIPLDVCPQRIRRSTVIGRDRLLVKQGDFVKQHIALPRTYRTTVRCEEPYKTLVTLQHLVDNFNRNSQEANHWIMATHIADNALHAISVNDAIRKEIEGALQFMYKRKWVKFEKATLLRYLRSPELFSTTGKRKRREAETSSLSKKLNKDEPFSDPDSERILHILPKELLITALGYLDTITQTMLRRTCTHWDYILSPLSMSKMIWLSGHHEMPAGAEYQYAAFLYKRWNDRTQIIAFSDCYLKDLTGLLQCIMQASGRPPIATLVLSKTCCLYLNGNNITAVYEEVQSLAGICGKVVLGGVKIDVHTLHLWSSNTTIFSVQGRIGGNFVLTLSQFYSNLEDSLPSLDRADIQRISDFVSEERGKRKKSWESASQCLIAMVLNGFQSSDPRDVQYAGRTWCHRSLKFLDVDNLTKLTMNALLKLCIRQDFLLQIVL